VTHYLFEPRAFCERYPLGAKELLSAFQRFQAKDTVEWFQHRGIQLVPESDGRMFPITNTSETIIRCFQDEVARLGVEVKLNHKVDHIQKTATGQFEITLRSKEILKADAVMIATGSNSSGHQLAKDLGHTITPLAPSLF
jgi:predicted flavoprotein YhiN